MKRLLANLEMSSIFLILGTLIKTLHTLLIYIPWIMSLSFEHISYSSCAIPKTNVFPSVFLSLVLD
jgi:hypothetical protein